ncbi:MAG TPA: BON domain-containing protein [Acidobacteriaceae bacterium]|nr:BON domain-containing protein [Acidobacteriaceae bacterium]
MTAKNSDSSPLYRPRMGGLRHRLAIGAVLSAAACLCVAASAQTAPSSEPASSTASASTPANPNQRPDSAIAEDINTKLMANNTLRPLNLGIWVHNGTATLTGTVPTQELRTEAENMVKSVAGVQNVDDKITIGAAPAAAPGFSGQNGESPNTVHPGDAQGPPPPPQAGYEPNENEPAPPAGYGQNENEPPPPPAENYGAHQPTGMVTVEPGTPAYVMVMQPIDSKHTKIGTPFHGILVQNIVMPNGVIAIPRGADIIGTVVDARGPGKLKGRPHLALQLTGVNVSSTMYPLTSQVWVRGGPGKGGQSAANIGGSAAAGAIIGGAVGGGPTALLGGLLGGLGGAGLSSLSSGPQLYIPPESVLTFYISAPVTVHVPTYGEIQQLASRVPPSAYGHPGYGRGYPPPPGYYPPPRPVYYPPPGAPPGGYPY